MIFFDSNSEGFWSKHCVEVLFSVRGTKLQSASPRKHASISNIPLSWLGFLSFWSWILSFSVDTQTDFIIFFGMIIIEKHMNMVAGSAGVAAKR